MRKIIKWDIDKIICFIFVRLIILFNYFNIFRSKLNEGFTWDGRLPEEIYVYNRPTWFAISLLYCYFFKYQIYFQISSAVYKKPSCINVKNMISGTE